MIFLILLIVSGLILQAPAMLRSGLMYNYGIGYWGPLARDGVWHEALSNQLKLNFPPTNPGFAGTILTDYHYFYDWMVALLSRSTAIPVNYFIYQIFPLIFSVLLGVGTYILAKRLFNNKVTSLFAVFLAYFGSSFGWLVDVVKQREIGGESAFWANQPVSMNLNPPYAISLIILIFGIILIDKYLKKPKFWSGLLLVLMFGTIIGFKAYAGAIVIASLFVLTLKKIIFEKSYSLLPIFFGSALIFGGIFFAISRGVGSLIAVQPLWLIDTMIDAGDRVGIPNFTARRFAYLGGKRWFNFAAIELLSLLIFFAGNLGTRIVGIWGLRKKFFRDDLHIFIFLLMGAAVVPTLLFVQKGNPWNVIQFFYYFLYFAGLYAAFALTKISTPLILIFLIVTPISSLATFRGFLYPTPPAYLPTGEYQALTFLNKEPAGTVLKHPFDDSLRINYKDPYMLSVYADNSYISAYSSHPVYIEDAEEQIILDTDFKPRLADANRFFIEKDLSWSKKFLLDNKIQYIYLPKIYQLPMAEQEYPMVKIFENSDANIYQVK